MSSLKAIFNWRDPSLLDTDSELRHWLLLANIILVNLVLVIEAVGISIPMDQIQGFVAVDATKIDWVNSGFLLCLGVSVPLSIYLSRKFGYKTLFFAGLAAFVIGALLSGMTFNYSFLLFSRMISGIGGGMIFPISLTIIKKVFKGNMLALAMTIYVATVFGIGLALGCIIGGVLSQLYAWRMILLLGVFVGVPCLGFTWILMKETAPAPVPKFDFISYAFFSIFLISTLFYLTQVKAPWNTLGFRSEFSIGCMICSALSLFLFIRRYKRAKSPLFALSIFRRKEFSICCFSMAFVGVMIFGSSVAFIDLLIGTFQYEKNVVGKVISVFGFFFGLGGLIPVLLGKWVKMHVFAALGLAFIAFSCFVNHSLTIQSTPYDVMHIMALRALGASLALGPLTAISLAALPDDLAGQGAAIVTIFRQVGGAYGASVITVLSTVRFPFHLTRFSEMVNPYSAAFQNYLMKFKDTVIDDFGKSDYLAEKYSKGYIISNVVDQAKVAAFDDAFFIFGCIFTLLVVLMIYLALCKDKRPNPRET